MRLFLPFVCAMLCALSVRAAEKPNIILIYADDLGYGDVSCYGSRTIATPNVDRLAAEGLRFTDAYCTSATCTPSRYSMLTGEYAWRRKGTGVLPGNAKLIIEAGRTTLASVMKSAGYRTGVVGKWHLGLGNETLDWNSEIKPGPLELGFDTCFLMPATGDRVPCVYVKDHRVVGLDPADPLKVSFAEKVGDEPTGKENPDLLKQAPSHGHDQTIVNGVSRIGYMTGGKAARWVDEDMADVYVREANSFITAAKDKPFFLYFSTHDIHVPRLPHARFAGKSGMGPRGDAILSFDWCVGELLKTLDAQGLTEKTLILLSSDNGPVVDDGYRDEAKEKLGAHQPAGPLRGGKYSLFEAGTRVPFIVRWPGRVKPGVSSALISQVDLCATFAALTGQEFKAPTAPDTMNMLPALLGESATGREWIIHHANGQAIRRGNWKFIPGRKGAKRSSFTDTELGNDEAGQLYDLSQDPGEKTNVAAQHPEIVKELRTLLQSVQDKQTP